MKTSYIPPHIDKPLESVDVLMSNHSYSTHTTIYYESRIIVNEVTSSGIRQLEAVATRHEFRAVPGSDAFVWARDKTYQAMETRMSRMIVDLIAAGYTVRRYKIDNRKLDSEHQGDVLKLLNKDLKTTPADKSAGMPSKHLSQSEIAFMEEETRIAVQHGHKTLEAENAKAKSQR